MTEDIATQGYMKDLRHHIDMVKIAGIAIGMDYADLVFHDHTKWSSDEFPHYVRQFHGDKGDPTGFANAWLHHIHHNPHHWEHWIFPAQTPSFLIKADIVDGCLPMPEKYALEMIADWLGSSFAYTGSWDMSVWLSDNFYSERIRLHPTTRLFVAEKINEIRENNWLMGKATNFYEKAR